MELVASDASKATISRSMTTVWQRWTRLRSVARGQERVLEDTAREWRTFREKVHYYKLIDSFIVLINDYIIIIYVCIFTTVKLASGTVTLPCFYR